MVLKIFNCKNTKPTREKNQISLRRKPIWSPWKKQTHESENCSCPFVSLSILSYCCIETFPHFQNISLGAVFLKPWERFIPRREMWEYVGPFVFTYVSSPEGRCVGYPVWVAIDFTYTLFGLENVYNTFQTSLPRWPFFLENVLFAGGTGGQVGRYIRRVLQFFLSPEEKSGANPMGSTWQSFQFNMCMRNQNWTFKNTLEDRPFLKPRKPLSPEGRAERTQWGPLGSLSILYVIEKPKLNFQKSTSEDRPFLKPQKPLSPEGRWVAYPLGVQLFLLMF